MRWLGSIVLLIGLLRAAHAQEDLLDQFLGGGTDLEAAAFAGLPSDPQALADAIRADLVRMRGLEFRQGIAVTHQAMADFEAYLDGELERAIPAERALVFDRVVRKLGLYQGPVIDDAGAVMRQLATSQVAAYYDPDSSEFYVLLQQAPMSLLAPIYAHELYHGLQDQYFDLDQYLLEGMDNGLNDDEILARQAVVEGEATYVMNLWALERSVGEMPPRWMISAAVMAQSMLSTSALAKLSSSDALTAALGEEMAASAKSIEELPAFMIETMLGAYMKGMAFVHAVAADGWDNVARLYSEPPASTEQILHPAKWIDRDDPVRILFPELDSEAALRGWDLLESNVIGEFQWRIIFAEFGQQLQSGALAAGWDGDRYAVLERGDELLLLLLTTWDSEADAAEFLQGYEALLQNKYQGVDMPKLVEQQGADVLIVEGGDRDRLEDYRAVLLRADRQ